ncbi:MAG: PhzF family phenazine biosynthesis protein [Asticcacaulis sp.]
MRARSISASWGPYLAGQEVAWEIRTFFSDHLGTMREDPVTGSFNASAAQWLLREGLAMAPYVAAQGTQLGRAGRIYIDRDADGQVWVGGRSRTLFVGEAS